jgi:hypothetical protein
MARSPPSRYGADPALTTPACSLLLDHLRKFPVSVTGALMLTKCVVPASEQNRAPPLLYLG